MKKLIFLIPFFLNAGILSDLENKKLNLQQKKILEESASTKKSWINPIILQYTITQSNPLKDTKTFNKTFSITLNQPIFKSGAIYYSIKYANDLKNLNEKNIIFTRKKLIKTALDLAYEYKITKLNEKILKLNISNALIDVKRKKENYKNGILDLTFLNNSIISLNSLRLSLVDIKQTLINIKSDFQNISDLNINNVNLKLFKIVSLNDFLNNNIELKIKKLSQKVNNDLYKMQIGNSLVTIFVNGSYNYQKNFYSNDKYEKNTQRFYSIGVGISIPIDIRAKNDIQKSRLNYLVSKYDYLQTKRELINEYKKVIITLKSFKEKIKIYEDNVKLYDELINSTKEDIKAGNATTDDLKILQNSKEINLLQIRILNFKIQKLLLSLYYKMEISSN